MNFVSPPIYNEDKRFVVNVNSETQSKNPLVYNLYDGVRNVIDFEDKTVLDFGGSWGNLLQSSRGRIKETNYTSLDVDPIALEEGKEKYPDASWIHYNRFNVMYNRRGKHDVKIKDALGDKKFDIIFAYSVFTHTTFEDFLETVEELKEHLTDGGKIFVSMCLQQDTPLMEWYRQRRIEEFGEQNDYVLNDTYIYIANNRQILDVKSVFRFFLVFYDEEFLKQYGTIHYDAKIFQTLLEVNT